MSKNKEAHKISSREPQKGSPLRILAEAAVWLWALSILGYFYYSRNFLTWLQQLWEKASG